jgi:hypothetical protein
LRNDTSLQVVNEKAASRAWMLITRSEFAKPLVNYLQRSKAI